MAEKTIQHLLDLLATHGGKIISSNSASVYEIEQARASGRMYVDSNSLGYIWKPEFQNEFPTTVDEVKLFEWCYPIQPEIPEELKTLDWYHKSKTP